MLWEKKQLEYNPFPYTSWAKGTLVEVRRNYLYLEVEIQPLYAYFHRLLTPATVEDAALRREMISNVI